jgi:hypothetical protein
MDCLVPEAIDVWLYPNNFTGERGHHVWSSLGACDQFAHTGKSCPMGIKAMHINLQTPSTNPTGSHPTTSSLAWCRYMICISWVLVTSEH